MSQAKDKKRARKGARGAGKASAATPPPGMRPPLPPAANAVGATDEPAIPDNAYRLELPSAGFEGPLDLLLHLIQKHELDILDIPVAFITDKYLEYLRVMETLTIDVASEYLVMAATLVHIKSKMLLPELPKGQEDGNSDEEELDPREELVRRLLEYQKYKQAAELIAERGTLGKDVFPRGSAEPVVEGPAPFAPVNAFALLDAFDKILRRAKIEVDHEVIFDRISITDRIVELTERMEERRAMRFEDFFPGAGKPVTRFDLIITFLAVLEMARLKLVRVYQAQAIGPIYLEMTSVPEGEGVQALEDAEEASRAASAASDAAASEPAAEPAAESVDVASEPPRPEDGSEPVVAESTEEEAAPPEPEAPERASEEVPGTAAEAGENPPGIE